MPEFQLLGLSPDGSILIAGSSGSLVTDAGTWSFSTAGAGGGYVILLNGQPAAGGSAIELEVANQGHLYADNLQGQWWQWNGAGWAASTNPTPSSSLSPDGSILIAGSSGSLVTDAGTWSFSTAGAGGGSVILLNGQPAAGGSAVELEVANQGHLYADNLQGQWWQWNGAGWAASTNPTPSSSLSPDGSILTAGSGGSLVTGAGTWSFSTAGAGGGSVILLNGQPAAGGSAVELEVANQGRLYADNLQGQWWQWNGSGWTTSADPTGPASTGHILSVGPSQQYSTISAAVAASHNGDTIEVQAGTYINDFATINTDITLRGVGGMVNMVCTEQIPNGKAIFVTRGNDTIENFSFSGAQVGDQNGAGIRYEAGNLILNKDYFHDNQEGLLAAADPNGTITINNSEFDHNGIGDGFTHNLYVSQISALTINDSYFHDAVVGHEIKSRAAQTTIENSRIHDGPTGTASYSIDLPNGGKALIQNNVIEQGPFSQNPVIIASGEEGNIYANTSLEVYNNEILNDLSSFSALAIDNRTGATAQVSGNELYGLASSQVASGLYATSNNTFLSTEPALVTTHPWLVS